VGWIGISNGCIYTDKADINSIFSNLLRLGLNSSVLVVGGSVTSLSSPVLASWTVIVASLEPICLATSPNQVNSELQKLLFEATSQSLQPCTLYSSILQNLAAFQVQNFDREVESAASPPALAGQYSPHSNPRTCTEETPIPKMQVALSREVGTVIGPTYSV